MQEDREPDFLIQEAARYIVEVPRQQRGPAIPELRRRFGLDPKAACVAVRLANAVRAGGADATT
ncbi:hypothetical protein JQK88_29735 [Mesorhizobium caraganae]|uniref:hypothetical protein n=1 Tax=Mesorhizobium caraganae TaxID=483206 RepID=UPI00177ACF1A|nr:hypothetical protein [Mesorhizobium caraganae]MBM2715317.1 hypothetical protein [Mesorhizobium caraganae]